VFEEIAVTGSGAVTDPSLAVSFAQTALVLACDAAPMATLSSTPDGARSLVVDNFLTVNGVNVCGPPGLFGCGSVPTCDFSCFAGFLGSIPPIDLSGQLVPGRQLVTFELMDWGGFLISSDLWLVTNCQVLPQVAICHKPGTAAEKTLLVAQSAVPGHLGHGDTLDPCD
jgi:hypothetical protein